jgi:phospholipase/lecithinase/hemolysin
VGIALHAQTTFSSVVVFGDSLSDTGNVAHVTGSAFGVRYPGDNVLLGFDYTDGRFTDGKDTQPAAAAYLGVWAEQLALSFPSKIVLKNSLDGGTDYAYGDATTQDGTTTLTATIAGQTVGIKINNMGQQVTDYLATNPTPNAQTLYILWGGANDLYADDSMAGVQAAVQREIALMQRLINAGATNFMVPNLPPLGGVPEYASGSSSAALNAAAASFAAQLAQGLAALKISAAASGTSINIYPVDVFSLFAKVVGNPMALGFGNLSSPAQNVSGSPDSYLSWDGLHPTTTGHHFIAASAANLLTPLAASSTALTVPPAALAGQSITMTAVVTSTASATKPTGGVTFFNGTTAVASAPLDATGTATASLTQASVASSPYSITAVYQGDTTFNPSQTAAQSIPVISAAIGTSTTLTSSNLNANAGSSVVFTAIVTPSVTTYGPATGTVTFLDGMTPLGSGTLAAGVATLTTSSLTAGPHSITAQYAASGVFAGSTSSAISEVVIAPSFTGTASPSSLTITSGSSATTTITAAGVGGFSGTLTLSCGTLPAHLSCLFSVPQITVSANSSVVQSSTLTVATNAVAAMDLPERPGSGQAPRFFAAMLFAPALGGMLLAGMRRRRRFAGGVRLLLLLLLFSGALLGMSGCGGAGSNAAKGTYTVPVNLAPASGTPYTISLQVMVQ